MKVAVGGFDQCYNAQALVDTEWMRVRVPEVTRAANDKQQVKPKLEKLKALPAGLNDPATQLADRGDLNEANVAACHKAEITPLIALGRQAHHLPWQERFGEPALLAEDTSDMERMQPSLKTRSGRKTDG